ncbi:SEC10/PgrA surface exclusion domain-containing protein [Limosilactobacillus portuensis]|uniref:SEC10/PgrA surface exclusion domain-containing protein n=1 Tax=Limosilactobacillus portuensis TaxID=2742601 RepID=UPI003D752CBD
MKEHKKLYKSGKLWMTATVMALAAGTTVATTTAHADATPATNTTSEAQNTDQQKAALQKDIQNKQQQVSDKTSQAANLQSKIDGYKGQVNDENTNYQNEQAQIKKDAADKATSVDSQINDTQTQLDNAKQDVSNTQSQINNVNSQISDLQKTQGTTTSTDSNIVSVPNGQIDKSKSLLENAARNDLWDNHYSDEQSAADWNKNIIPNNIYVSPDSDKTANHGETSPITIGNEYMPYTHQVDIVSTNTGMTENQMRELSILLLNELNHAREQRGLAPFVMTEDQFKRAMARAQQSSAANLNHNESDMDKVLGNWHSENLAFVDANANNLARILYNANDSISSMLMADADSDWGHRDNFLDNGNYNAAFGFKLLDNGYYLMTFDTTYATDADKSNDLVTNTINNYAAMGPTKGSTTTVDNTAKINQLKDQLTGLSQSLIAKQNQVNTLQSQLDDLNNQKNQISSDEQTKLADSTTKHNTKLSDLNDQISTNQTKLDQLNNDIKDLKVAIAQDQTALDNLNKGGQTPVEAKKDNEKYTNLNPSLVVKVNVTAGDTNIPAPTLTEDAFIKDTNANTASAAMFMVLAQTNGTYPEGTTVEWADPAKVQKDAQAAGTYDEEVILDFPDGSKSKAFNVPGVLVVAAKQTPSTNPDKPSTGDDTHTTDPTKPTTPTETTHTLTVHYIEITGYAANGTPITKVVGTQTFTGKQGDTFSGSQLNIPAGYKLAMDGVSYTIGDQDETNNTPVVSVNTPSDDHKDNNTPSVPAHRDNNQNSVAQLPAGAKVVNGQVVDANGNVLPGWKVVNGQAVKSTDQPVMTREAYKAQQQAKNNTKTLPQTGNTDNLAVMGLGAATLLGMFGLAGVNKKRN